MDISILSQLQKAIQQHQVKEVLRLLSGHPEIEWNADELKVNQMHPALYCWKSHDHALLKVLLEHQGYTSELLQAFCGNTKPESLDKYTQLSQVLWEYLPWKNLSIEDKNTVGTMYRSQSNMLVYFTKLRLALQNNYTQMGQVITKYHPRWVNFTQQQLGNEWNWNTLDLFKVVFLSFSKKERQSLKNSILDDDGNIQTKAAQTGIWHYPQNNQTYHAFRIFYDRWEEAIGAEACKTHLLYTAHRNNYYSRIALYSNYHILRALLEKPWGREVLQKDLTENTILGELNFSTIKKIQQAGLSLHLSKPWLEYWLFTRTTFATHSSIDKQEIFWMCKQFGGKLFLKAVLGAQKGNGIHEQQKRHQDIIRYCEEWILTQTVELKNQPSTRKRL